jgi:hypothetical protein
MTHEQHQTASAAAAANAHGAGLACGSGCERKSWISSMRLAVSSVRQSTQARNLVATTPYRPPRSFGPGRNHPAPTPSLVRTWSRPPRADPLARAARELTIGDRPRAFPGVVGDLPGPTPDEARAGLKPPQHDPAARSGQVCDHPRSTLARLLHASRPPERSPAGRSSLVSTRLARPWGSIGCGRDHARSTVGVDRLWSRPCALDRGGRTELVATIGAQPKGRSRALTPMFALSRQQHVNASDHSTHTRVHLVSPSPTVDHCDSTASN